MRINGVLQPEGLSVAGQSFVPSGTTTTTIETTIIGPSEMQGRFLQDGTSFDKTTGRTTSAKHEYGLGRIVRHVGDLPPCARHGGEVPPPGPVEPPREDMSGVWIGEYREIHCETNTGARCDSGERGWARLRLPGPAYAPTFVTATVELGVCTSTGTIQFGELFSVSGPLEPRRLIVTGLRESRQGNVGQSVAISWGTTILSATEMVGGIAVNTVETRDGMFSGSVLREHDLPRARKMDGPPPSCTPQAR